MAMQQRVNEGPGDDERHEHGESDEGEHESP